MLLNQVLNLLLRFFFSFLVLPSIPMTYAAAVQCLNTATNTFGDVFLSNAGDSLVRGPITMVLPEDSGYSEEKAEHQQEHHRRRRHVVCGRTRKRAVAKTFEERAVCAFHHVLNKNEQRVPQVLEEVSCDCSRPSHLSPYTEIRCQPVKYKIPVLLKDEHGQFQPGHEELTLACIPVAPRPDEDFELIDLKRR